MNIPDRRVMMRALLFFFGLWGGIVQCCATPTAEAVKAVDLPREIFTGENLKTEGDMRRILENIMIAPRGGRFSKQQLKGMEDILTALLKVAVSEKIDAVRFSASCDLFATLEATLGGKEEWKKIRSDTQRDGRFVDLASVISAMQTGK